MISVILLIFECAILGTLTSLGIAARPTLLTLPMIILFAFSYIYDISRDENVRSVRIPLTLGLLLRVGLVLFDIYGRSIYVLPNSGADAEMFYSLGVQTSLGLPNNRGFFIDVLGYAFKILGVSRLYVQFLLMLCSVVALHMGHRIMRECGVDEKTRYRTMMILCLLPNFAILSSIMLRESVVTMFVTISLYFFVRWMNTGRETKYLEAFIFAFIAMVFHSGTIALPVAYLFSRLIFNPQNNTLSASIGNIIITVIVLIVSVNILNQYGDRFMGKFRNVESIDDVANMSSAGGSSYTQYVGNSNSIPSMVVNTVPRLVFFMFSPMPFQWRGLSDIIAFAFNSVFYIVVIFNTLTFLRKSDSDRRPIVTMLFVVALAAMFVFAWGTSNTGTAVRHRDKMVVLYGILLGLINSKQSDQGNCKT